MCVLLLSLCPGPASADSSAWEKAEKITQDRVAKAKAALPRGSAGKTLAKMADQASTDRRLLAELYTMQAEHVDPATREWRDGPKRRKQQEASSLLLKDIERVNSDLRMAIEAAEAASARIQQSGVLEKMLSLEAAAKEAGARLAGRWEFERLGRQREREQREREAAERAREQRR
jgi:hypothetical protein